MPATNKKQTRNGARRAESMAATKHTEGPWAVVNSGASLFIVAPAPAMPGAVGLIAEVSAVDFKVEAAANARVLGAAPDLLAALKALRDRHQIDEPHHANLREFCKMADAAIAKAEGR